MKVGKNGSLPNEPAKDKANKDIDLDKLGSDLDGIGDLDMDMGLEDPKPELKAKPAEDKVGSLKTEEIKKENLEVKVKDKPLDENFNLGFADELGEEIPTADDLLQKLKDKNVDLVGFTENTKDLKEFQKKLLEATKGDKEIDQELIGAFIDDIYNKSKNNIEKILEDEIRLRGSNKIEENSRKVKLSSKELKQSSQKEKQASTQKTETQEVKKQLNDIGTQLNGMSKEEKVAKAKEFINKLENGEYSDEVKKGLKASIVSIIKDKEVLKELLSEHVQEKYQGKKLEDLSEAELKKSIDELFANYEKAIDSNDESTKQSIREIFKNLIADKDTEPERAKDAKDFLSKTILPKAFDNFLEDARTQNPGLSRREFLSDFYKQNESNLRYLKDIEVLQDSLLNPGERKSTADKVRDEIIRIQERLLSNDDPIYKANAALRENLAEAKRSLERNRETAKAIYKERVQSRANKKAEAKKTETITAERLKEEKAEITAKDLGIKKALKEEAVKQQAKIIESEKLITELSEAKLKTLLQKVNVPNAVIGTASKELLERLETKGTLSIGDFKQILGPLFSYENEQVKQYFFNELYLKAVNSPSRDLLSKLFKDLFNGDSNLVSWLEQVVTMDVKTLTYNQVLNYKAVAAKKFLGKNLIRRLMLGFRRLIR